MRFRKAPGFSPLFIDYAEGAASARSCFARPPGRDALLENARRAAERDPVPTDYWSLLAVKAKESGAAAPALDNLERLISGRTAVILAAMRSDPAGWRLCDWLKAVTAAKLAAWISDQGVQAVPLLWIDAHQRNEELPSSWWLTVSEALNSSGIVLCSDFSPARFRGPRPEPPDLRDLEAVCKREGRRLTSIGYPDLCSKTSEQNPLPDDHGMWPGNDGSRGLLLAQAFLQPAACVAGEADIGAFACSQAALAAAGFVPPVVWPRMSATIIDGRSGRLLSLYRLNLEDLFQGCERLVEKLDLDRQAAAARIKLEQLKEGTTASLAELREDVPVEDSLHNGLAGAGRRMLYQVGKLENSFAEEMRRRRETIARRIPRLCGNLVPGGDLQERQLAGIDALRQLSPMLPQLLLERLDPWEFEHQLFFL